MKRKAQGALEYLLLIAGAVIIATVVIVVAISMTSTGEEMGKEQLEGFRAMTSRVFGESDFATGLGDPLEAGDILAGAPDGEKALIQLGVYLEEERGYITKISILSEEETICSDNPATGLPGCEEYCNTSDGIIYFCTFSSPTGQHEIEVTYRNAKTGGNVSKKSPQISIEADSKQLIVELTASPSIILGGVNNDTVLTATVRGGTPPYDYEFQCPEGSTPGEQSGNTQQCNNIELLYDRFVVGAKVEVSDGSGASGSGFVYPEVYKQATSPPYLIDFGYSEGSECFALDTDYPLEFRARSWADFGGSIDKDALAISLNPSGHCGFTKNATTKLEDWDVKVEGTFKCTSLPPLNTQGITATVNEGAGFEGSATSVIFLDPC